MDWQIEVPLYGGAIMCDLPVSFGDVSRLREVPDHQEVWVDNAAESDQSFIMEINERKDDVFNHNAVEYFFQDLVSDSSASEHEVLLNRCALPDEVACLPSDIPCFFGQCRQKVSKFNESVENIVIVHLLVVRLLDQRTDILVLLHDPEHIDPQSSSGGASARNNGVEIFSRIARTLRIIDWDLFGE